MGYYKEKYDCVVIGASLAGLTSALVLASKGYKVLVLEKNNLPGGFATSFVRNKIEMDASLDLIMSIGQPHKPLKIRSFFEEMGIKIEWMKAPEAYRLLVPSENIDIILHAGFSGSVSNNKFKKGIFKAAKEIDEKYPGSFSEVNKLLNLCASVYNSVNILNLKKCSKLRMLLFHNDFLRTLGYTADEVINKFKLKKEVKDILKAYWIYAGSPFNKLSFTAYAMLMADYFIGGNYVPKDFSHELSLKMSERCLDFKVQMEYNQNVIDIAQNNNHIFEIKTNRNDIIYSNYVISSFYPNVIYSKMFKDSLAFKKTNTNSNYNGLIKVSVILVLDKKPSDLNIKNYLVFSSQLDMDLNKLYENSKTLNKYDYLTAICLNYANKSCVEDGLTSLSITYFAHPSAFFNVDKENYSLIKRKIAKEMIEATSKRLNVNLFEHITEIEIEMPHTILRYTNDYLGFVYGYRMDDHFLTSPFETYDENYIKGFSFTNSSLDSGCKLSQSITNGINAANNILKFMKEDKYNEN